MAGQRAGLAPLGARRGNATNSATGCLPRRSSTRSPRSAKAPTRFPVEAAEPEQRVEAGLGAVLTWVAEEPGPAWALFVEASCATSESLRRFRIINGEAERATELLPELTAFLRLPFIATGPL